MKFTSTNPAKNYEPVVEIEASTEEEIEAVVALANSAKHAWNERGVTSRVKALQPIVNEFKARRTEIAQIITSEVGKPIKQALHEVERYVEHAQWYLDNAEAALADELTFESNETSHRIVYEPYGVLVAIAPWNFPFGMAVWGIIPSLVAGNVVVFKTSEECPAVGKLIEEIILKHNLPDGVFAEVYGDGEVGEMLTDQEIQYIWFTGSTRTGKLLYKKAADAFIRCTLEMGGSSPCVIFGDVAPVVAAKTLFAQRFKNCGQVCTSLKRLIVHETVHEDIVVELAKILEEQVIGDPDLHETTIGSLAAKRQVGLLEAQLQDALDKGAQIVAKKDAPKRLKGAYFSPVLLQNVSRDMRVWNEEVFGPILPIVTFQSEQEAIQLANDTEFGLNARVMSRDIARAERVAAKLQVGGVRINESATTSYSDPFGGYKSSGIGREHGVHGLRELCQMKVIAK